MMFPRKPKEEWAYVLDFLPVGHPANREKRPIAQVIGVDYFTLLKVAPKPGVKLDVMEKVYIGEGKRDKIASIIGRINVSELTASAYAELEYAIQKIVEENERKFVEFFNTAGPLTTKLHQLELLPGIGKKHMWEIIEERKKKPFESFEDIKKRVTTLPDPKKAIVKRVMEELEGTDEKWFLFVPRKPREF